MRTHLSRLSTGSRLMAASALLIAMIQLAYLLYLIFVPPAPETKSLNPAINSAGEMALAIGQFWCGLVIVLSLLTAGLNWLASAYYRQAAQYRLLMAVAGLNAVYGAFAFNLWLTSLIGCAAGLSMALYAVTILMSTTAKKIFLAVETGKSLEDALQGRSALSGLRPATTGSGVRGVPAGSGPRPTISKKNPNPPARPNNR